MDLGITAWLKNCGSWIGCNNYSSFFIVKCLAIMYCVIIYILIKIIFIIKLFKLF